MIFGVEGGGEEVIFWYFFGGGGEGEGNFWGRRKRREWGEERGKWGKWYILRKNDKEYF